MYLRMAPRRRRALTTATTFDESPVFVPCNGEAVFGVLTAPVVEPRGAAVVFPWGAAGFPSFGKNLLLVRLARRAAESGFHALRFDYVGSGDSSGIAVDHRLHEPPVEEVEAVCRWLGERGLERVILVGSCSGARIALSAAPQIDHAVALGLISPPVMDYTKEEALAIMASNAKGTTPEWSSAAFRDPLAGMLGAGTPVLLVYGKADGLYKEFERARSGRLGELLEAAGGRVTVRLLDGWLHADPTVAGQDELVDVVGAWLAEVAADGVTRPVRV